MVPLLPRGWYTATPFPIIALEKTSSFTSLKGTMLPVKGEAILTALFNSFLFFHF